MKVKVYCFLVTDQGLLDLSDVGYSITDPTFNQRVYFYLNGITVAAIPAWEWLMNH